jgi:riboflavin synthase
MFTGIVEEVGRVGAIERHDTYARLVIECTHVVEGADIGDSIAVAGCCLTVSAWPDQGEGFAADLMAETLRATALGDLAVGDPVNLERAMAAGDRLGGHLVQGHVDAVGEVVGREEQPGTVFLDVAVGDHLGRYLVPKGSVTVDGTSLTVVDVRRDPDHGAVIRIGLIPHTLEVTTFGARDVGDRVNLEVDVIAKYVERLLAAGAASPYAPGPELRTPATPDPEK